MWILSIAMSVVGFHLTVSLSFIEDPRVVSGDLEMTFFIPVGLLSHWHIHSSYILCLLCLFIYLLLFCFDIFLFILYLFSHKWGCVQINSTDHLNTPTSRPFNKRTSNYSLYLLDVVLISSIFPQEKGYWNMLVIFKYCNNS